MRAACCQATLNGGRPDSRQSPRNVYRRGRRRRSRTDRTTDTPAAQRRKRRVGEVHGALSRLGPRGPRLGAPPSPLGETPPLPRGRGASVGERGCSPGGAGGQRHGRVAQRGARRWRGGPARAELQRPCTETGERSPWRAARCGKTAARGEAPARICGRPPRASLPSLPSR
ncbi:unnamed protein product, partial [Prorocentrum cordatum]